MEMRIALVWVFVDYICRTKAQTLVAHWPLDAASGQNDVSGNNFHLAASFSPTYMAGPHGETDGATIFTSSDVPMESPDMASLIHPLTSVTITAWVYHRTNLTDGYPFRLVDNAGGTLFHIKTAFSNIHFKGRYINYALCSFPIGQWFYLAVSFNASSGMPEYYVDGVQLSGSGDPQTIGTSWIQGNGGKVIIGQHSLACSGGTCAYGAALSDIRFYADIVQTVYQPPGPVTVAPDPLSTLAPLTTGDIASAKCTDNVSTFSTVQRSLSSITCAVMCQSLGSCVNITVTPLADQALCSGFFVQQPSRHNLITANMCHDSAARGASTHCFRRWARHDVCGSTDYCDLQL